MCRGRGHRHPNSLLIRTVQDFPLVKGVRIIEVGLYVLLNECEAGCVQSIRQCEAGLKLHELVHAVVKRASGNAASHYKPSILCVLARQCEAGLCVQSSREPLATQPNIVNQVSRVY